MLSVNHSVSRQEKLSASVWRLVRVLAHCVCATGFVLALVCIVPQFAQMYKELGIDPPKTSSTLFHFAICLVKRPYYPPLLFLTILSLDHLGVSATHRFLGKWGSRVWESFAAISYVLAFALLVILLFGPLVSQPLLTRIHTGTP